MGDIDTLQLSSTPEIFSRGIDFFFQKWKRKEKKFCEYFEKTWIRKNSSWYEGYEPLLPSTNNALEATNDVLKRKYTMRRRLDVAPFNTQLFKFVHDFSKSYDSVRSYKLTPTIPKEQWSQAIVWAKNEHINHILHDDDNCIYVPSSTFLNEKKRHLNEHDIEDYENFEARNFDQFFKNVNSIWKIQFDDKEWTNCTCSCPQFLKKSYCKHTIGLAIRLKICEPPPSANPEKLAQKKKRGRRPLAKKALIKQ